MHQIEPYYGWRDEYEASQDKLSPFYRREYSELYFTNKIYNYLIHPQWDFFGSSTLYCKIIFADYENHFVVIELIGEWNDALHNDIMELKRGLVDPLIKRGIVKFILIGENVLNFHPSDELYYEEWYEDIKEQGGWIAAVNFREHITDEMHNTRIHYYVNMGEDYADIHWRKLKPENMPDLIETLLVRSLE